MTSQLCQAQPDASAAKRWRVILVELASVPAAVAPRPASIHLPFLGDPARLLNVALDVSKPDARTHVDGNGGQRKPTSQQGRLRRLLQLPTSVSGQAERVPPLTER